MFTNYYYFVKYKGKKLSNIFDLHYKKIYRISLSNYVITCTIIVFYFIILIFITIEKCCHKYCVCFPAIFIILSFLLYIARFILSIVLFYFMETGDIGKYDDFLECEKVKVEVFNKFTDINRMRKIFYSFVIFNIIVQGIDKVEKFIEYVVILGRLSDI